MLLLMGCNSKKEEQTVDANANTNLVSITEAQLKNATIEIGKLEKKSISSLLKVTGKIDVPPQNMVSVSMPLGGYLTQQNYCLACILQKEKSLQLWKTNNTFNCNRII